MCCCSEVKIDRIARLLDLALAGRTARGVFRKYYKDEARFEGTITGVSESGGLTIQIGGERTWVDPLCVEEIL